MAKILLVEDDKSLREIYGVRLLAEGYDIVSAGDGEEALALAIKERPNLILSDVMMPKISGFDMLDILRSTTETRNIKVIIMTALSSEDQRQRGESLGADLYLVKSQVGIEDVVRAVKDILGNQAPAKTSAPNIAVPDPIIPAPSMPSMAAPITTMPRESFQPAMPGQTNPTTTELPKANKPEFATRATLSERVIQPSAKSTESEYDVSKAMEEMLNTAPEANVSEPETPTYTEAPEIPEILEPSIAQSETETSLDQGQGLDLTNDMPVPEFNYEFPIPTEFNPYEQANQNVEPSGVNLNFEPPVDSESFRQPYAAGYDLNGPQQPVDTPVEVTMPSPIIEAQPVAPEPIAVNASVNQDEVVLPPVEIATPDFNSQPIAEPTPAYEPLEAQPMPTEAISAPSAEYNVASFDLPAAEPQLDPAVSQSINTVEEPQVQPLSQNSFDQAPIAEAQPVAPEPIVELGSQPGIPLSDDLNTAQLNQSQL